MGVSVSLSRAIHNSYRYDGILAPAVYVAILGWYSCVVVTFDIFKERTV